MEKFKNNYSNKIEIIKSHIKDLEKPYILELGVKQGISTKMFLEVCDTNDGNLVSIDIDDYSNVSKNPRWKFVHSSDDNFDYTKNFLVKKIDVLFIDSLHEPDHIRKVFYYYYDYIRINGYIFIDDVVWLPYVKNGLRDSQFVETVNRTTFDKILEIYNSNIENLSLDINFTGSGLAILKKKKEKLNKEKKIKNRLYSFKNLLKKIYSRKPKR